MTSKSLQIVPLPQPLREHEKDDHQKEQQDQSLLAHQEKPSSTEEARTPLHRRLLFYSVKRVCPRWPFC